MSLVRVAADALAAVRRHGYRSCLVGGLAVSARCDPRFTRDADLAVAVADDEDAESLVRRLALDGYALGMTVEQEATGRLAMVRLTGHDGISIDVLFASSGIEADIVDAAEQLEIVRGITLPVAAVGHLIALKLLSAGPGRETDTMDLRSLAAIADDDEWGQALEAVQQITARGYARDRDLIGQLARWRSRSDQ